MDNNLDIVEMELEIILGVATVTLAEFSNLTTGSILDLNIPAGEQSFLLVNGAPIARGDVLVLEKHIGLRISKVFDEDDVLRFTSDYFGT